MVIMRIYCSAVRLLSRTDSKSRFQGHGRNRLVDNTWQQQNCKFFSFPKQSRNREYRGRQLVGYTMEQMYEVVADVENYHKFVPWCKQSVVKQKSSNRLVGELIVGFPPINENYTSIVTLVKPHLVKAECTDGRLFEHLITVWRFSPGLKKEQQSCVVDFHIDFEFRSVFHSQISNLFFDQVAKKMEGAFIAEVGNRFGTATMPPRNLLI
ncbi:coenzyme Q-binding protein COQ10 homolog A, mitochondrial [Cydia amplana]|uniref:coenzyme Q-binding protein COQ10 homolog A, mitochondrial n=1 Tax=Cydia amplana TaxID=1869771 RepID=UPI002FE5AC9C